MFRSKLCQAPPQVLFYCHYPDLLLARRGSRLHALYRGPLDWAEQASTGTADVVLVNSEYTRRACCRPKAPHSCRECRNLVTHADATDWGVRCTGIFADTFVRLHSRGTAPAVLHPAVQPPTEAALEASASGWRDQLDPDLATFLEDASVVFLSINRFERKKVGDSALRTMAMTVAGTRACLSCSVLSNTIKLCADAGYRPGHLGAARGVSSAAAEQRPDAAAGHCRGL